MLCSYEQALPVRMSNSRCEGLKRWKEGKDSVSLLLSVRGSAGARLLWSSERGAPYRLFPETPPELLSRPCLGAASPTKMHHVV